MRGCTIIGSGYAHPKRSVSNQDFEKIIDTNDEWIQSRTGINSRYLSESENTSDLAYDAALDALNDSGIDKECIEVIVCCTMTPDNATPSIASLTQAKLGLNDSCIMAFDVNAACSGFLYGLQIATHLLDSFETILVIGSEVMSKLVDYSDRSTCILFGDGAGAMILKREENIKPMVHYANGHGDLLGILEAKGLTLNLTLKSKNHQVGYLKQNGNEVYRFARQAMREAILEVLEKSNQSIDHLDLIIAHQANARIIQSVARSFDLPLDKFFIDIDRFGNTSAASIPIAFADAKKQGLLKQGMKIVLVGFGGGFTYGATYIEL